MEEEINLRIYVDVLLRQWKVILSVVLVAVIIGVLISFLSPSVYEAKAAVLITRSADTPPQVVLVDLVKSNTVATQVIERLGDKLDPEERTPAYLLDKVQVAERDNLIEISVEFTDAHKAAAIANAWAESYESHVNSPASGLIQSLERLQAQADVTKKQYKEKQKALEDFIGDSDIDRLIRQIADMELLYALKTLREQIKAGPSSSASDVANNLALILLQAQAFTGLPAGVQIKGGSSSSASNVANNPNLILLPAQAFTGLPAGIQIALDQLSDLNASPDDVDALISMLETRAGLKEGQTITGLQQEINQLKADLEQEQANQRELESSRDISWQAYTAVTGKIVVAEVAAQTNETSVRIADVALVPESRVAPRPVMNIVIALVLGIILSIFCAFGVEYFRRTGKEGKE
jgi:uncharacterized protein involved in exopolysaccharide biosynthesis